MKVISFGAGVNSIAMTIMLFKRGEIYPVVFADTIAEHPETYCYMDYFEKEFMSKYGEKIIKINPYIYPELYPKRAQKRSLEQYCIDAHLIIFTQFRFCTSDWKIAPIEAWQKKNNKPIKLIGFAYDEKHRGINNEYQEYPLIEKNITRRGCIEIIKDEGLAIPHKSGCFFCPFQSKAQWQALWRNYPELFNRAEQIEINATKNSKISKKICLSPSGKPLSNIKNQLDFPDWDLEELEPCICKL